MPFKFWLNYKVFASKRAFVDLHPKDGNKINFQECP